MAREEELTFERITRVYRDESQRKTLTPVEPDFYDKVKRYVAGLEADVAAEREKDPNSKAAMLLQDELRKARQKRDQIYRYRERKIGLLASALAGGAEVDTRPLARPERELLHGLVAVLSSSRGKAIGGQVEPSGEPAASRPPASEPTTPASAGATPGVLVRILEDVPPFAGLDGTYRLQKEDIVTLPPPIAKVLLDRGKARLVTPAP